MLLVEHDEHGTFGLVLNRQVDLLASTLCASLEVEWHGDPDANIQWGGPVEPNTGWLLFDQPVMMDSSDPAITPVGDEGLCLARSLDVLKSVTNVPESDVRFYLGYAGWGPGQLESEMVQGAWLVAPSSREVVFGVEPDAMWEHVVRGLGVDPATLIPTHGVH